MVPKLADPVPPWARRSRQNPGMDNDAVRDVLHLLGVRPRSVSTLKDLPPGNGSWLVDTGGGERIVLRRYHDRATAEDLDYEHRVLRHLAQSGWVVPDPVGDLVRHDGLWFCLTRYVPGAAVRDEPVDQRRRRGRDMARVDVALRDLTETLGQRPGWRAQHAATTVHAAIDWGACLAEFTGCDPRLAGWAAAAAAEVRAVLASIGAEALPLTVVHGDLAEWNVHYLDGRLAGVVDFALTHLDSRPYELAIARTWRAPEAIEAYADELARHGWPLTQLEQAAIGPVNQAFRVDMVAWELDQGRRTGAYDIRMIERQLRLTGVPEPDGAARS